MKEREGGKDRKGLTGGALTKKKGKEKWRNRNVRGQRWREK